LRIAKDRDIKILLTYIFTVSITYGEGLSLPLLTDLIDSDRNLLRKEFRRSKSNHPDMHIETKMIVGEFLQSLQELKKDINPEMIIMGAIDGYSELWIWNDHWLNDAQITVSCPVLVIPEHITYNHIKNIAFAYDYKKACYHEQIEVIKKLVTLSGANFYIVHVTPQINLQEKNNNINFLKEAFKEINPHYYTVENKLVIKGLAGFVQQYQIDLLLVIQHRHGLWHRLFTKNYTRQLAESNHLPMMAIHENNQILYHE
jgi:hypothetical protein